MHVARVIVRLQTVEPLFELGWSHVDVAIMGVFCVLHFSSESIPSVALLSWIGPELSRVIVKTPGVPQPD